MKKILAIVISLTMLMGCIVVNAKGLNDSIVDITVSESDVTIESNGMSEFIEVFGVYDDDSTVDITELVEWTTDNSNVVVADDGRLLAQGPGSAKVCVTYQGVTKEISVKVEKYVDYEAILEDAQEARTRMRTSSAERDSILAKASAMYNFTWVPTSNVRGWDEDVTFVAGTSYRGMPYSQTDYQRDNIGFLNALNNAPTFYDDYVTPAGRIAPKYGNDCSGYVSFAFAITRHNTTQFVKGIQNGTFPKVGSYNAYNPSYSDLYNSYASLQYGDAVAKVGHTFIIAANYGASATAYICYEQTPPSAQYTVWYRSDLANQGYMPFSKN